MNDFRCWVEIDKTAISNNIRLLKSKLNSGCKFLIVVKGDAYGHGIVEASRIAISEGASFLGVAYLEEAKILRTAGITTPILLLTQPFISEMPLLIKLNVIPTVYSYEFALSLSQMAVKEKKIIKVHVKIDTGFHRLGIKNTDAIERIQKIYSLPYLKIEGCYTHFASAANDDLTHTKAQFTIFVNVINNLKKKGITIKYIHTANSPAFVWFSESQLNLVRLGMAVFGLQPSLTKRYPLPIEFGLTWKTRILQIKDINKGESVGYDNTWQASKGTRIATIAAGYADGFRHGPNNFGYVLCGGFKCPIIGKVSMSLATIKINSLCKPKVGDEVVIIGHQGKIKITPEDIAKITISSNEEIVTNISKSLPRIFI